MRTKKAGLVFAHSGGIYVAVGRCGSTSVALLPRNEVAALTNRLSKRPPPLPGLTIDIT
jgi:hypothetical protein